MKLRTPTHCLLFSLLALFACQSPHETPEPALSHAEFIAQHPYWEWVQQEADTLPKMDRPDLAAMHDYLITMDPATRTLPVERLHQTLEAVQTQRRQAGKNFTFQSAFVNWEERGPTNYPGRTRAFAWDPNDPTHRKVWAGGTGGGLWYNNDITDDTSPWQHVDDFWDHLTISCMAFHPNSPQTMYVGTGEGWFAEWTQRHRGGGIWKSNDGGNTWYRLFSTFITDTFVYVNDLAVHPTTGDVYAATRYHGLQRSQDGGNSWERVLGGGYNTVQLPVADIEIAADGDLYVAMGYGAGQLGRIYRSTTGDRYTWSERSMTAPTRQRITLAAAPSAPETLYALAEDSTDGSVLGVYRTLNGGLSWTACTLPDGNNNNPNDISNGQAWIHQLLEVSPTNPDVVYVGSVELYGSVNGGSTWTQLSAWHEVHTEDSIRYMHADLHGMYFRPGSDATAAIATDGGVFLSYDLDDHTTQSGNTTWDVNFLQRGHQKNTTQFYFGAIHPDAGSNYLMAGSQDNGTMRTNAAGASAGIYVRGGDGVWPFIDADDPDRQIAHSQFGRYSFTTDGWATSTRAFNGNTGYFISPADYSSANDVMVSPFGTGSIMYLPSAFVFPAPVHTPTVSGLTSGTSHIRISPNSPSGQIRTYIGTFDGSILRIEDVLASTTALTGTEITGGALPDGAISCVEIFDKEVGAPDDTLLVTLSNYGIPSVWLTLDGGATWTSKEDNLPDMPVRWALINPMNFDEVLLATEAGVWSTRNLTGDFQDWSPSDSGMATVRVDHLDYRASDHTILASTHGRGMYTGKFSAPAYIGFEEAQGEVHEGTLDLPIDCRRYQDFRFPIKIEGTLEREVSLSYWVSGGNANPFEDYEILNTNFFFTLMPGDTVGPTLEIRVYEDYLEEGDEFLEIALEIFGYSNAYLDKQTHTLRLDIFDDDLGPDAFQRTSLLSENWNSSNSSFPGWTVSGGAAANLSLSVNTTNPYGGSGNALRFGPTPSAAYQFAYLQSGVIDATGYNKVSFTAIFQLNNLDSEYLNSFSVQYKRTSDASWQFLETFTNEGMEPFETDNYLRLDRELPGMEGEQFEIRLVFFTENTDGLQFMSLDNLRVSGHSEAEVATTVFDDAEMDLGPFQTIHFYDYDSERILASITNLTGHDYGCTEVEIDRAGNGTVSWGPNSYVGARITRKNFHVIPEFPDPYGIYRVRFYFQESEVAGWEAETGNDRADLNLVKAHVSIPDNDWSQAGYGLAPDRGSFGGAYYVEALFNSGFSGFAASIDGPAGPLSTTFPVEWLGFAGEVDGKDVRLNWTTASERNNDYFEVLRSADGQSFQQVGEVSSRGTSDSLSSYEFYDYEAALQGKERWFYQLRQVDRDGTSSMSRIVEVLLPHATGTPKLLAMPLPGQDAEVSIPGGRAQVQDWRLIDAQGRPHNLRGTWQGDRLRIQGWEILPEGIYYLQVRHKQGPLSLPIRWMN